MAERRHPADVTADRLARHYEQWFNRFSGAELVAIGAVRTALLRVSGALPEDDDSGSEFD